MIVLLLCPAPAAAQGRSVPYAGLTPGVSTKAQVDLALGEPLRKVVASDEIFEYAPPRNTTDTARVVVDYWTDTLVVSRIDVYPKDPPSADAIRAEFGTRVIMRRRADGALDELFFPTLVGLIVSSHDAAGRALGISYLSPRMLGWVYVRRFNDAMEARKFDEARTEAEKAVLVDPDGAEGYHAQGRLMFAERSWTEALARFQIAANARYSATDRSIAHQWSASIYENHLNAPDKARSELAAAVADAPPHRRADAHVWTGEFLVRQKKPDEAATAFRQAIALDREHRRAHRGLGDVLFSKNQYAEALPHFEIATRGPEAEALGNKEQLWFRYAYCLATASRYRDAIPWYEKLLPLDFMRAAVLNNLASAYRKSGDPGTALGYVRRGLVIAPKDTFLNATLTNVLLDLGQFADALNQSQAALAVDPQSGTRLLDVARCYGALNKKKDARQWAVKAVAAGFRNVTTLQTDPFLALLQDDGDYRQLIASIR